MPISRRRFLEAAAVAGAGGCAPAIARRPAPAPVARAPRVSPPKPAGLEAVLARALDVAKREGATYADARIHKRREQHLSTREDHVVGVYDGETYGIGVRVIAGGAWGFASNAGVTEADAIDAAKRAVAVAKADSGARNRALDLAPCGVYHDKWQTDFAVDPFQVSLAEKAALVLSVWPIAKQVPGIAFCSAECASFDEWKLLATSEGTLVEQRIVRVGAGYTLTAKNDKLADFVTRTWEVPAMQAGWEHITKGGLVESAKQSAEETVEKLKAPRVTPGKYALVLAPSHLWLTIHESIGHSTELDRAMGYEADLAGTSFATPDKLGKLRYGKENVTFFADKTTPGGLATCAWDDDGVKTGRWNLIDKGLFVAYQTTREQAAWIGEKTSRGTSYAQDHRSVAFQRMPNVSLAPGPDKRNLEDIVAATDKGIAIHGDGSWSIDQQRYNFQFGGQLFYAIKGGKIAHMLRDVAYQSNTLEFWHSCDMIGGQDAWALHGTLYDGKGEPGQSNAVSHGTAPARFRDVNVLYTGGKRA